MPHKYEYLVLNDKFSCYLNFFNFWGICIYNSIKQNVFFLRKNFSVENARTSKSLQNMKTAGTNLKWQNYVDAIIGKSAESGHKK